MENNKQQILTDSQVEEISNYLEENVTENTKKLREVNNSPFPYNTLDKRLESGNALVEVNPSTGETQIIKPVGENKSETVSNIINGKETKLSDKEIEAETTKALSQIGIENKDIQKFIEIMNRVQNNEKFNIYKELPDKMKQLVMSMYQNHDMIGLNKTAKILVEQFINQLNQDKEFVELQNAISKELNIPGLMDIYSDHLKDTMETQLLDKAKIYRERGMNNQAEALEKIAESFNDSYTFRSIIKALDQKHPCTKKLDKYIKKYIRECDNFNFKYSKSKMKIKDVNMVGQVLRRHLDESITDDEIKKFVVLFTRFCMNLSPDVIAEHAFMYYTIINILSLDFLDKDKDNYKEILNNITVVIEKIRKL